MMLSSKKLVCTFGNFNLYLSGRDVRLVTVLLAVRPKSFSNANTILAIFRHFLTP